MVCMPTSGGDNNRSRTMRSWVSDDLAIFSWNEYFGNLCICRRFWPNLYCVLKETAILRFREKFWYRHSGTHISYYYKTISANGRYLHMFWLFSYRAVRPCAKTAMSRAYGQDCVSSGFHFSAFPEERYDRTGCRPIHNDLIFDLSGHCAGFMRHAVSAGMCSINQVSLRSQKNRECREIS